MNAKPTEVIYARVPGALKADVAAYADRTGVTLNSAIADLLECGLEERTAESSGDAREDLMRTLEGTVADLRSGLAARDIELARLQGQQRDFAAAAEGLSDRLERPVAQCPVCKEPVSGGDVLLRGACSACRTPLSSVLTDNRAQLNQGDYMLLLGAIGIVLALWLWQAKQAA